MKTSLYHLAFKILDGIANTMFRVGSWFSDRAGDCLDRSIEVYQESVTPFY